MAKILLLEDDPVMSRMYQKMFVFHGHQVDIASDGEDGMKQIHESLPDLILLDVMMPKMNGLEVLDKLKNNPKTRKIPVVMLTNLGVVEEINKLKAKGIAGFLTKADQDPKKVVEVVDGILANHAPENS